MVGKMKYQSILQDIQGELFPVGIPDEEGSLFFTIDEQVMKFGSLQHDSINWDNLITHSQKYLSEVCKDYKVLQYFGYAVLYKNFALNFIDFIELFSEFNKKYLFLGHPKPSKDNTVNRFKEKAISLIIERIENAFNNNSEIKFTALESDKLNKLFNDIFLQLDGYIANVKSVFDRLQRRIKEQTDSDESILTISKEPEDISFSKEHTAVQRTRNLDIPNIHEVDLQNVRKLKQMYLQIADITCSLEPTSILSYISRRFGLWHSISQLPEMDINGVTAMQAVPADKLSDYRELVSSSPSLELLSRIEKTVTTSPYWVEGSYLSAKCCQALKMNEAAEAIKNVTRQFVSKFSTFSSAKFQNGEPFLSETVSIWLEENEASPQELKTVEQELNNFDEIYNSEGFVAVLKLIDEQLKQITDIRSKNYLQFEKIRYFLKEEMFTIALTELSELIDNCKKYTVEEWDNNFFIQLSGLKDKLLKDNQ